MADQQQIAADTADVGELRQMIAALRLSEGRFAKAFHSSADALIISRLSDGAILEVNASYERVVGYQAAEIIGKDRRTIQIAADLAVRDRLIQRLSSEGFYRDEEMQIRQRSGAIREVRASAETFDVGGEVCVLARLRDISEQKATERALIATDERLRMALAAARMGIWEWDVAGDRVVWSAEANAIFGLAPRESVNARDDFLARVHPDDRAAIARRVAELIESRRPDAAYEEEHRIISSNGEVRWVSSKGKVVFDEAGNPVRMLGTVADATDRKRAEEQAQRNAADLLRMARIRTADQMASSMAHELNQPLAAISLQSGIASSLAAAGGDRIPADLAVALKEIGEQAHRAGGIIRSLRDFLKRADPTRGRLQVNEVVREVVRLVEAVARQQQVRISLDLQETPAVVGDRIQIAQVLLNLLQNALDALRDQQLTARSINVTTGIVGRDSVQITVADNGPGITKGAAERIFERFYTTKSGGVGLGLAISRSIVEAHGGKLWFESRDGQGTAFHVRLPLGAVELRS